MATCEAKSCYSSTNHSWENYCSYHERCLSKLREYHSINNIQEIETFTTYFNGNCGYVINYDYSSSSDCPYYIWIVVYEPKEWNKEISENLKVIKNRSHYSILSGASSKAQRIKNKLQNNGLDGTPIVKVHHKAKSYEKISNIITSPYVVSYPVGTSCSRYDDPSNFDSYARPLDIIRVEKKHDVLKKKFDHVGVYLGNNKVCHFYDHSSPIKHMKSRVDDIGTFLGHTEDTSRCGRIWVYHPIIPFKNYQKIAQQIAYAERNDYWKGQYDLANKNCEHLANMLVYGINYSEQVERNEGKLFVRNAIHWSVGGIFSLLWHEYSVNNGKSTLKLTNELRETENKLGYTRGDHWRAEEIQRKYLQEVPPKENCRIM